MPTATLTRGRGGVSPSADQQVTSLDEVAETIREAALAAAREKLSAPQRSLDLASLLCRPDFFERFKHGLATAVSQTLAANDSHVQATYVYEPSANPDIETGTDLPPEAALHLLVLVTQPSAALEAFVAALDRALTATLKTLPSNLFAQRESVLDVNVITEKDVRLGLGYAAMLASVFAPPLKVWQREA